MASIMPTYQQVYSMPEVIGVQVELIRLRQEDSCLDEPRYLVTADIKLICINNPNIPTGVEETLEKTAEILFDVCKQFGIRYDSATKKSATSSRK